MKTERKQILWAVDTVNAGLEVRFNQQVTQQFKFAAVVQWFKLGEVENECTSHNFSLFVIFLRKIIKIEEKTVPCGNLTKFWQKQFCTVFLRHSVYIDFPHHCMTLSSLVFADMPLRNYALIHTYLTGENMGCISYVFVTSH